MDALPAINKQAPKGKEPAPKSDGTVDAMRLEQIYKQLQKLQLVMKKRKAELDAKATPPTEARASEPKPEIPKTGPSEPANAKPVTPNDPKTKPAPKKAAQETPSPPDQKATQSTPKKSTPPTPPPAAPAPTPVPTPAPKNVTPAQSPPTTVLAKPNNQKLGNEFLHRLFALRKKLFEEHKSLLNTPAGVPEVSPLLEELTGLGTDSKDFKKYLEAYRDILPSSPQNTQQMVSELEEKISQLETRLNDLLEKTIDLQNEILLNPPTPSAQSTGYQPNYSQNATS